MNHLSIKNTYKILNFLKERDPRTWWRDYPPKIVYNKKSPNFNLQTVRKYLESVFLFEKERSVGLYIHLPFCFYKCTFCMFFSEVIDSEKNDLINQYLDCLEKEITFYGLNFKKKKLSNIYFGGGTPTLLTDKQWTRLIKVLKSNFSWENNIQISVEGTPDTTSYSKAKLLINLGINRFSLGVQTFDDKVLKKTNRKHTSLDGVKAFYNLKKAGFKIINFDLIFGLSGETKKGYEKTLKKVIFLKPDRISFYFLDISIETGLYKKLGLNQIKLPKKEILEKFNTSLTKAGYVFDKKGSHGFFLAEKGYFETTNQNLLDRWNFNSVLGLGSGAESILKKGPPGDIKILRFTKNCNINNYINQFAKNKFPYFGGREYNKDETLRRYLIHRLVCWRGVIEKKDFTANFAKDARTVINEKFKLLSKSGLILEDKETIYFNFLKFAPNITGNCREAFSIFAIRYLFSQNVIKLLIKKIKENESFGN